MLPHRVTMFSKTIKKHLLYMSGHLLNFTFLIVYFFFLHGFTIFCPSMSISCFLYLCLTEAQTECGPISLCRAECWGRLQIKKPSPGCAHQAVQHCSPGRFTTYILFYGPFLIHHNTTSILLTSPAKHTSLPVPSVFFTLFKFIQYPSPPSSQWCS